MNTKNKVKIGFSTLAVAAFMTVGTSSAEAFHDNCDDQVPRASCTIWNIKINTGGMECNTGGEWKCEDPTKK